MGGPAASHNNFWQLFVRPAATGTWRLVTPPGVASNGGLVVATPGRGPVVAGFRPSQDLSYSPLATTHDNGTAWTPAILDAGLADVPDALAVAPAGGRLLALLTNGSADISGPHGAGWTTLASQRTLAATPAGRRCGLRSLTAAAYTPSGRPLLAGTCSRPGTAGIFAASNQAWQAAGPVMPAALARQQITILRLASSAGRTVALLAAGSGRAARPLRGMVGRRQRALEAVTPAAARRRSADLSVIRPRRHGGHRHRSQPRRGDHQRRGHWRALPALPPGTVTLAPGTGSQVDALAVHRATLTVWQLSPSGRDWAQGKPSPSPSSSDPQAEPSTMTSLNGEPRSQPVTENRPARPGPPAGARSKGRVVGRRARSARA